MKRGFLNGAKAKRENANRKDSDRKTEGAMLYATIGDEEQVSESNAARRDAGLSRSDIPGKGVGLVSMRALKMGDLILSERPLFVGAREIRVPKPPSFTQEQYRRHLLQKAEEFYEGSIERMRAEDKNAFMELHNCHSERMGPLFGCGPILGIMNNNGLSLEGLCPVQPETRSYSAVCKHISRLNHSCSPNTASHFHKASFSYRLYAYLSPDDALHTAAARQKIFRPGYDFVCACPACTDPSVSDPRRATIAAFAATHHGKQESTVAGLTSLDDDRFAECRTQLDLIESEGLEHLPVYFTVLKLLMEASVARGDVDSACKSARKLDKCHWVDDCDAYQDHPLWRTLVDYGVPGKPYNTTQMVAQLGNHLGGGFDFRAWCKRGPL
ncbi:SET domain-containing protein [Mycena sanguinolenta]|uniref:SET domain-containing protein n=1 Tax=Mycena sanguinolenta TaxID=230812 RepID=A0A8H6XZA8_9AGAR|nr:SET domain-containing protein [Mycena sanguinolenta]